MFNKSLEEHLEIGRLFENKQKELRISICSICREIRLESMDGGICDRCKKFARPDDINEEDVNFIERLNPYSIRNNMYPGEVPDCLKELTLMEQIIISPVKPYIHVFYLKSGGQYGYNNQVISFNQDINQLLLELPRALSSLSDCVIFRNSSNSPTGFNDIRVRRQRIKNALEFLLANHKYFINRIRMNENILNQYPENGTIEDHLHQIDMPESDINVTEDVVNASSASHSNNINSPNS